MTDKIDNSNSSAREKSSRRRLLKILAGGGGTAAGIKALPAHWTQPVMENVMLPAHAQTTTSFLLDPCDIVVDTQEEEILFSVSGLVIGTGNLNGIQIDLSTIPTQSGTPTPDTPAETSTTTAADGSYGPIVAISIEHFCPQNVDGVQVTVTSPDPRLAGQVGICTTDFMKNCEEP